MPTARDFPIKPLTSTISLLLAAGLSACGSSSSSSGDSIDPITGINTQTDVLVVPASADNNAANDSLGAETPATTDTSDALGTNATPDTTDTPDVLGTATDTTATTDPTDALGTATDTTDTSATNDTPSTTDAPDTPGTAADTNDTTTEPADSLDTTNAQLDPVLLEPLPATPLSEAPGADDEPTNVDRPVTTITEFFLVEDPARRIEPKSTLGLTEQDFDAGTPEAIVTGPANFDTNTNAAPYFEGISNREVFAGQTLEVLYRPLDDDGGLPGMFPNELPESASFNDNLNGTKSLSWTPLQGDIGITSFTVTAVDSEEPNYRSEQKILIKVLEPADLSTIPNFPPVVNEFRTTTVRVGDAVVMELKGSDRNSTYPSVEIPNPPPGATVTPHYIFDEITVLRFIPTEPGVVNIDVIARDADDPNLTGTRTVSVIVKDSSEFELPGQRLRALASARNFQIGFASLQEFYHKPDGAIYSEKAGLEFNIVSAENSMKWDYINPEPGTYRWADADNLLAFARRYNQTVHGHPMIWYTQLPIWIREAPAATLEMHMREFIDRLATRYGDDVAIWDVVNEPIDDAGGFRDSIWFDAMGEEYIDIAFRQARMSDPDGILLLNEYDIAWDTPKSATLFPLLESLQQQGTPIDGVGFQLHIDARFDKFDEVIANFQRVADMGLDIYVTELDVSIFDAGVGVEEQAQVFERILDICLNQPRCKALQLWGYTDQYSWRRNFTPLILDTEYQVKPGYLAIQRRLAE